MRVIFSFLWAVAAWKWGDWRNWERYYPTILFFITVAFGAHIISTNHRLWVLTDYALDTSQTVNLFLDAFIIFPATIFLYLSNFPDKIKDQLFHILKWVAIYGTLEYLVTFCSLVMYENGWSIWWSILFDCVMFPILAIHHKRPLLAWALSAAFTVFIWEYFGFTEPMLP